MPMKPKQKYQGQWVIFQGTIAAQKRLKSARMEVLRIAMYRGMMGQIWEADTDHGKRWVSHTACGWQISKTPPAKARPAEIGE